MLKRIVRFPILFLAVLPLNGQNVTAKDILFPKAIASDSKLTTALTNFSLSAVSGDDTISAAELPNTVFFSSLGRGYNPATGRVGIVCVEPLTQDETLPGSVPYLYMHTVTDEKSMAQASASSVSASGMFKFVSLGAGTSSTNSTIFNSVERYGRVYARIATKITDRQDVKWSAAAESLLKSGDITGFLNACGTRFVRTAYAGHLLDETVHFSLTQDGRSASNATSLSLDVGKIFGGSASFCTAQSSMGAFTSTELQHYGLGVLSLPTLPSPSGSGSPTTPSPAPSTGAPSPAPSTGTSPSTSTSAGCSTSAATQPLPPSPLQTLIDYYNDGFRTAVVADNQRSAVPLWVVLDRYKDHAGSVAGLLAGTDKIPEWMDSLLEAVLAKGDTYNDLIGALSDSAYAATSLPNDKGDLVTNLSIFYTEDEKTRKEKQDSAKQLLVGFQLAAKHCQALAISGKEMVPDPTKPGSLISAVTICQNELNEKLTDELVSSVKLTRKYK